MRADSSTLDEGPDDQTLDDHAGPGPIRPMLTQDVIELVLDRADGRLAHRPMAGRTPAVSVTVTARAVDLGAGPLAGKELYEVAARAVAEFVEHGFFVVARPGVGPTFLLPLPVLYGDDGEDLDEVVLLCRQLDEEQARARAVAIAQRFRAGIERAPELRYLLIEVRLGEGTIVGAPARVGTLLPAALWRPA